jgi:probable addiction module antidote protein
MTNKRHVLNAAASRDQPKTIARVLNKALASGDTIVLLRTIGDLLRAHGMSEVARKTGLDRGTLYKSFGGKVMPSIDRVIKTLAALEVELVAKPIDRSYRSA